MEWDKVGQSSTGILIPDHGNKKLMYLLNNGEEDFSVPLSVPVSVAVSFDANRRFVYQYQSSSQLKHIEIPRTAPEFSPKVLTQKFVQAYQNNDIDAMLGIAPQRVIQFLKSRDQMVKEILSNISSYDEVVYMQGTQAVVFSNTKLSGSDIRVEFSFVWNKGRWWMSKVN